MRFKTFYLKETENDLDKFQNQLKDKYELSHLRLFKKGSDLILDMIVVPKDKRKQGIGSKVLNDITHYADINGLRILLTTGVKDDFHGTTSSTRLKQFYKKFGFVENKGRNKDFTTSHNMIRNPKSKMNESEELLNEASQEYNIAKVLSNKIIRTLRDMAHYDLTHLDRYFKKYKDHRNNLYKIPMSEFMKDINVPKGGIFDYLKKGYVFLENGYLGPGDKTPWLYSDDSKTRKAGGYFDQHKDYFGIHLPFIDAKTQQPFRGYFTEFKSLIIHELTHFIQGSKEKFSSGTASLSSEEWYGNKKEQEAYLHELYNDLQNFVEDTLKDIKSYRYSNHLSNANYEKYVNTSNMLYKMFESVESFKKSIRLLERRIFLDNPKNRDRFLYLSTELRDVYNKFLEDSYVELKKEFKNTIPTKELKYNKE